MKVCYFQSNIRSWVTWFSVLAITLLSNFPACFLLHYIPIIAKGHSQLSWEVAGRRCRVGPIWSCSVGQGLDAQESLELIKGTCAAFNFQRQFHHSYSLNKAFVYSKNSIPSPKERIEQAQMDKHSMLTPDTSNQERGKRQENRNLWNKKPPKLNSSSNLQLCKRCGRDTTQAPV